MPISQISADFFVDITQKHTEVIIVVKRLSRSHNNYIIHFFAVIFSYQSDYWTAASKAIAAVAVGENPDIVQMGADHISVFSPAARIVLVER